MKSLHLAVPPGPRPVYLKLGDAIRGAIEDGRLKPGEPLPSTRELGSAVGAHRHTVLAALSELTAEGWLASGERRVFRVASDLPSKFFSPRDGHAPRAGTEHSWRVVREPNLRTLASSTAWKFNFVVGPDLRALPYEELKGHLAEALRRAGPKVLDYGDPLGHAPLVEQLGVYLRRVRAIGGRTIAVTHGSQEAIFLAAQLLLERGDRAAVEELGYRPAFEALRAAGAGLAPVRVDEEGLDPDDLARVLKRGRIRLLYLTPLHQYPTTATLSLGRRLRVYELCARHGVPILEDDYDHEFHYRCQPLAPMASRDPAGLILYVSTLSKVFSPSARLGFMAVPPALSEPLARIRRIVTRQNDGLLQDAIARWMRSGGLDRHLRRMRRRYAERRDAMLAGLRELREGGAALAWKEPDGGMAAWVRVKGSAASVAREAARRGVYVSHEGEHRLGPGPDRHLRLGFANQTPAELRAGLKLLAPILPRG